MTGIVNPATITVNGDALSLVKINQDSYGSEYLYRTTTYEVRLKIRHSKSKPNLDGIRTDNHNVEVTQTVYPVGDVPAIVRKAFVVFQNAEGDTAADASYLDQGLVDYLNDTVIGDLINWVN